MNEIVLGGIMIFFACFIIGRRVADRTAKTMACSERDRLFNTSAGFRKIYIVPLAVILIWYFAGTRLLGAHMDAVLYSVYFLLSLYIVGVNLWVYTRLRRENYSREYLRDFIVSRSITFAGLLVLIASLIIGRG